MNKVLFFAISLLLLPCLFSQGNLLAQSSFTDFFYGPNGKEQFTISQEKILIQFNSAADFEIQKQILASEINLVPLEESMLLNTPQ